MKNISNLYIGAYWGSRQESVGQCADRLMACLLGLRDCDEVFANWFEKGKSRKTVFALTFDYLAKEKRLQLLLSGRNKRDLDRTIMMLPQSRKGLTCMSHIQRSFQPIHKSGCGSRQKWQFRNRLELIPDSKQFEIFIKKGVLR